MRGEAFPPEAPQKQGRLPPGNTKEVGPSKLDEASECSAPARRVPSLPAPGGVPAFPLLLSPPGHRPGLEGDDLFRLKRNSQFIVWLL